MSDSYSRRGGPRSVPDPDREPYEEMIRQHRILMAQKEEMGSPTPKAGTNRKPRTEVDHVAAGIAHVLDGPRIARKEFEEGHKVRALVDGLTAAADISLAGFIGHGLIKGQVKLRGPFTWRTKPWEEGRGAREWMGDKGIVQKGEHAHHALIPNKGWGKYIPDFIKNQPANIRPRETLTHTRIHSAAPSAGLPRFNALERYWHGTPTWWKAANASAAGHTTQVIADHSKGRVPDNSRR